MRHCDFCQTWHSGSCCHPGQAIVGLLRARVAELEAQLATARARHIREAVEGMPSINAPEADFVCVEWMSERGYPFRVTMPRAALLAALTKGNE